MGEPFLNLIHEPPFSGPNILLAEDSDDDAFFFERALKKTRLPYSLIRAANGKLAIEFLQKGWEDTSGEIRLPDLFFLDLKMPVLSGFEVLERLKVMNITPALPVHVLSGSSDQADQARALKLGASWYLVKPVTPDQLKASLERFIGEQEAFSEERACS